jgi:hypothetical protein
MRQEALALLQKGVILFQRKVYDGAMRTPTEYRPHLDGRSPDTTDENCHPPAWLSLRDCGFVAKKTSGRIQISPLSVRVAFCIADSLAHSSCVDM